MSPKDLARRDPQGYLVKVARLGTGAYGVRLFRGESLVSEGVAEDRATIRAVVQDLLRWANKLGSPSEMAEASRERNFCKPRISG